MNASTSIYKKKSIISSKQVTASNVCKSDGLQRKHSPEQPQASPMDKALIIIGATSCGKTDIALSLADQYGGELINGWAIPQIAGFPLATTSYDIIGQNRIPYHLFAMLNSTDSALTVKQYKNHADKAVEDILSRRKWPIFDMGNVNYFQPIHNDSLSEDSCYGQTIALRWEYGTDVSAIIRNRLEKIIKLGLIDEVAEATRLGRENDYVLAHNLLTKPIIKYLKNQCTLNAAKQKIIENAMALNEKIYELLDQYTNLHWIILTSNDTRRNVDSIKKILNLP